jgi:hypothetical protein
MRLLARIVCALVLLLTAGFCGFGVLATFEPGPSSHEMFRAGYAVAGIIATAVAAWLLLPGSGRAVQ